jgi:predicted DNA-binding transcriptional regulator YafY
VLETSGRLLRLLSLLQARRDWKAEALAGELAVTTRTVRRDVDRLRALGYQVEASLGPGGGYRLGIGADLPPLLLDDTEAVAVAVGLRAASASTVSGLDEAAEAALAKLERVMPGRLRARVDALTSSTIAMTGSGPTVAPDLLLTLAQACQGSLELRLDYVDGRDRRTTRIAQPCRIVTTGRRWYLVAHDRDRDDWRTFRVDRIEAAVTTGRRSPPADPPDVAALLSRSISVAPYRWHAKVRICAAAGQIAARVPPTVGWVEADSTDPAGACLLHTGSDQLDSLVAHVLSLGHRFEVLEPPELRRRIREVAAGLLRDHPPLTAGAHRTDDEAAGTRPGAGDSRRPPVPARAPGSDPSPHR